MKRTDLKLIPLSKLRMLKRNPQYLTPKQMESLKASIKRDGFLVPLLVRPHSRGTFEIISGNHRFMAASELKLAALPCLVSRMNDSARGRLAVNLNTIHGDPTAELLAPFLAELDKETLAQIHLSEDMLSDIQEFDAELARLIKAGQLPESLSRDSKTHKNRPCVCAKCGRKHFRL